MARGKITVIFVLREALRQRKLLAMTQIYGYIRTSRRLQEGVPGDGPCLPGVADLESPRALANIHRDVGVSGSTGIQGHQLDGRLAGGDTSSADCPERVEEQQSPLATTDRFYRQRP